MALISLYSVACALHTVTVLYPNTVEDTACMMNASRCPIQLSSLLLYGQAMDEVEGLPLQCSCPLRVEVHMCTHETNYCLILQSHAGTPHSSVGCSEWRAESLIQSVQCSR